MLQLILKMLHTRSIQEQHLPWNQIRKMLTKQVLPIQRVRLGPWLRFFRSKMSSLWKWKAQKAWKCPLLPTSIGLALKRRVKKKMDTSGKTGAKKGNPEWDLCLWFSVFGKWNFCLLQEVGWKQWGELKNGSSLIVNNIAELCVQICFRVLRYYSLILSTF